jgi:hypothetical protein
VSIYNVKNFPGASPRTPILRRKEERKGEGKGERREGKGKRGEGSIPK